MLKGKTILLGVTGSIAAYKMATLASLLMKQHATVHVLMTENATNFINPITFETLTGTKCLVDTFDRNFQYSVEHVSLAKQADLVLVAPATANVIAKMAHGLADDMLTTTVLACRCKKLVAPAMNTNMLENPITQDNIQTLVRYGMEIIDSQYGLLACKDVGKGKMAEPETMLTYILQELAFEKDMQGEKVVVTAGATREALDPVRFLSNRSTGKMGYALAKAAAMRGAQVTLISGASTQEPYPFVNTIGVESAEEMFQAVKAAAKDSDIIIKAAAVADYRPVSVAENKIKKKDGDMTISLERTTDILKYLGAHKKEGQFLCGFSMETENMLENSRKKLESKHVDMIVANNVKVAGAGFGTDTNVVTLITKDKEVEIPQMTKEKISHIIFDEILDQR